MKPTYLFPILIMMATSSSSQETTSQKVFEDPALVNRIEFFNPKFDQPNDKRRVIFRES